MPSANKPIDVIIYHNPECGTSRNTLGLIRNAGIEPHVIEYLKTPPSRALLKSLSSWRYLLGAYDFPGELRLAQKLVRLRQPRLESL